MKLNNVFLKKGLLIILIFLIVLFIYCGIFKLILTGTWTTTYGNDTEGYYTTKYILKWNNRIEYFVMRPDGTEDTYDLGKYRIRFPNKIRWDGKGSEQPPYYEMEYIPIKNALYETENNFRTRKYIKEESRGD